jgi:hypothetical protein
MPRRLAESATPLVDVWSCCELIDRFEPRLLDFWLHGPGAWLRKQFEGRHVSRSHHGEVATIQCCHLPDDQSLASRHNGRVDGAQRKVSVFPNQLCNAQPVSRRDPLGRERSGRKVTKKPDFCLVSEARLDQIRNLGDDQHRNYQRPLVGQQQIQACLVVAVIPVDVGI